MSTFEFVVALVGVFVSGGIFTFLIQLKKQNQVSDKNLIKDIYKEIGRLQQELKQLRTEKDATDKENLILREENMKQRHEIEELQKDNQEMKAIIEELRRKIDILLKTKTE